MRTANRITVTQTYREDDRHESVLRHRQRHDPNLVERLPVQVLALCIGKDYVLILPHRAEGGFLFVLPLLVIKQNVYDVLRQF